jgi:hypothetical protein
VIEQLDAVREPVGRTQIEPFQVVPAVHEAAEVADASKTALLYK